MKLRITLLLILLTGIFGVFQMQVKRSEKLLNIYISDQKTFIRVVDIERLISLDKYAKYLAIKCENGQMIYFYKPNRPDFNIAFMFDESRKCVFKIDEDWPNHNDAAYVVLSTITSERRGQPSSAEEAFSRASTDGWKPL